MAPSVSPGVPPDTCSMPAAAKPWHQFAPPATAQQRIAYLSACQQAFETVDSLAAVSARLNDDARGVASTFCASGDAASSPRCVSCQASASVVKVLNPFSDWATALCEACAFEVRQ